MPLLHKKRVTLQCLRNFMLLRMDLQDIPKIKPSSLHLRHSSCQPHHVTNTSALFRVPLEGCGTTRGTKDSHITFSNAVGNSLSLNESRAISRAIVSHSLELYFPFTCYYRQKYMITLQDGEGNGTGNHNGEKQRRKGELFSIMASYHGDVFK